MTYLRLFLEFFRTGLFAVGGGLATMPFLYHISDTTGWFSHADLANMIAVSESTPGPMGINMATYVGFTVAGIPGAVIATLGLVSPSIIVILIVAKFLETFRTNRTVDAVFYGLRPASCGLIAAAGLSVVSLALLNLNGPPAELFQWKYIALAAVILVLTRWVKPTKITQINFTPPITLKPEREEDHKSTHKKKQIQTHLPSLMAATTRSCSASQSRR